MTRPTRARRALPLSRLCHADALEPRLLLAADAAVMVKDVNAVSGASLPEGFVAFKGATYFRAQDEAHGFEWFRTDGTAAGTTLLTDINPGAGWSIPDRAVPQAEYAAVVGDTLFFAANSPATGAELWKTDGTAAGTVLVKDINPGAAPSKPTYLTAVGDAVFFAADDGTHGVQIWKSDGTEAGTRMLSQVLSGPWTSSIRPLLLGAVGGRLVFAAYGPDGREPWVTDGTAAGTVLLKNIYSSSASSDPGLLAAGSREVEAVLSNGSLYFPATDSSHGRELWKTDGTPEGTVLAADVTTGSASSSPSHLTDVNGTLYFLAGPAVYRLEKASGAANRVGTLGSTAASTGSAGGVFYVAAGWAGGTALLKNDPASPPTASGLTVLKQFAPATTWPADPYPYHILDAGGTALLMAPGAADADFHLWRSDGTPQGTVDVARFPGQPFASSGLTATWRLEPGANGLYFFSGRDALTREEPFRTDGTAAGTGRLIDLVTTTGSSDPGPYVFLAGPGAGRTLFVADDGRHGRTVWSTDGTEAGTVQLTPDTRVFPDPAFSAPENGRTYFLTYEPSGFGTRLWATDGTPGGTVAVKDFGGSLSIDHSPVSPALFAMGGKVYFIGHGTHAGDGNSGVWVSDGTTAGTRLVAASNAFGWLMPYGGALYFLQGGADSSVNLWKTDGSAAGTTPVRQLANLRPTSGFDDGVLDGVLYFIAPYSPTSGPTSVALWRTDGTADGTRVVKALPADLDYMVHAAHRLFLASYDTPTLWTSDGTPEGTGPLPDFVPALAGFSHSSYFDNPELTASGPAVYLLGSTPSGGAGVWRTDGTPAGTRRVVAVSPDVSTRALGAADGFFYFEQTKSVGSFPDGVLWRTDGTEAGTAAVADVGAPGLGVAGDRIYFAGTDPQHGAELWSLPRPAGAFVRGSAWSPAFKSAFDATGLGDAAYGYRVDDKGAGDALPWINVNELVVRLPATPAAPGAPGPATVTFQSQRGVNYAVTRVDPVAGDPRAFVFVLDKPLGGAGADGSSDGDRLTVTVRGAGGDGADLTLRLNVLQGDTDRSGVVAADDAAAVKRKFFTSTEVPGPAGDSRYSVFHDVDGSGSILANDFSEVKKRFFHTLPPAPAAPAAAAAVRGRRRPLTRDIFGTTAVLG